MPVNLSAPDPAHLHTVAGLRIGTAMAGIRKANRRDLVVFLLDEGAAVAGVFTKNRFCAAPVQLCQAHLAAGGGQGIRALVVNTGNANAGTGAEGLARATRRQRSDDDPTYPPRNRWGPQTEALFPDQEQIPKPHTTVVRSQGDPARFPEN